MQAATGGRELYTLQGCAWFERCVFTALGALFFFWIALDGPALSVSSTGPALRVACLERTGGMSARVSCSCRLHEAARRDQTQPVPPTKLSGAIRVSQRTVSRRRDGNQHSGIMCGTDTERATG